jgi:hypothetical protein
LTDGGPAFTSQTLGMWVFNQAFFISNNRLPGYAATIAMVQFILVFAIALVAVLLAATRGRAVIRENELGRVADERPVTGVHIGIRPGTIGGYVILGLLSLIYLIPLLFVRVLDRRAFC